MTVYFAVCYSLSIRGYEVMIPDSADIQKTEWIKMERIFYPFRFDAYKTKIQSQLTIHKLTLKQKYNDEDYRMAMLFILRKWHLIL